MLTPDVLRKAFDEGLAYERYVSHGTPDQRRNWEGVHAAVSLTPAQKGVLAGFTRDCPVLVSSGLWCGDCVHQCPIFDHFERAAGGRLRVRFIDRDEHREISEPVKICGGLRVPTVIFMNEDFEFVSLLGDRTISRYRAMAARQLGAACPLPGAGPAGDDLAASIADWLDEFERVQLILRLSAKLRQRHGD